LQRWYARDAGSAVQQQQQQEQAAAAAVAPTYTGYIASFDIDVLSALAAAGSSHQLQLWSAETPALYVLVIKLQSGGEVLEVEGCQVSVCKILLCVCGGGGGGGGGGVGGGGLGEGGGGKAVGTGTPLTAASTVRSAVAVVVGAAVAVAGRKPCPVSSGDQTAPRSRSP
jgi:hypothetical protein